MQTMQTMQTTLDRPVTEMPTPTTDYPHTAALHALATAMRLGALQGPQAFSELFDQGGSCAMGAALVGFGMKEEFDDSTRLPNSIELAVHLLARELGHGWETLFVQSPVTGEVRQLGLTIFVLNDSEKWPRVRIADWLDSIANQPEANWDYGE